MNKLDEQMLDEARRIIDRTIERGRRPDEAAPELDAMIDAKLAINKTADDKRATSTVVRKDAC